MPIRVSAALLYGRGRKRGFALQRRIGRENLGKETTLLRFPRLIIIDKRREATSIQTHRSADTAVSWKLDDDAPSRREKRDRFLGRVSECLG